ncbi:class I SAM-dependent methyltransferase [Methanobacterium sp.]|uniref:class I SAM-dependent methyltransferase n=1 Tax=Methanobacterium sp. TaxID=2164 RepID=UPI0025E451AD|nr:class I SAM-dependent methyltransferase [Methanobacterium sp.]MBI5459236.1 class I SAM-dependent methyltransferase [Methanobacterium sp.]
MKELQQGYPKLDLHKELLRSNLFIELEKFSNVFINQNKNHMEYYSKKWVADPFHWWSREWEYPYVYQEIKKSVSKKHDLNILDAGSGFTFFPFFISSKYNRATITCADNDKNLKNIFDKIKNDSVSFKYSDITNLQFEDNSFDLIYSISVLEHFKDYKKAINELNRVLDKDGTLILTFDVSLYGLADMSIKRSKKLIKYLLKYFKLDNGFDPIYELEIMDVDNLLSIKCPFKDPPLMQKMSSVFKNIIYSGNFTYHNKMTVFCLSLRN